MVLFQGVPNPLTEFELVPLGLTLRLKGKEIIQPNGEVVITDLPVGGCRRYDSLLMCHIEEDLRMHIGSTLTQRLAINAMLMTFAVRVINARALILGGGVAEAYTERAEDTTMQ